MAYVGPEVGALIPHNCPSRAHAFFHSAFETSAGTRNHVHRSKVQAAHAHHRPTSDELSARRETRGRTLPVGILSLPDAAQGRKYAERMGGLGYGQGL
jgi:hypothetical protein